MLMWIRTDSVGIFTGHSRAILLNNVCDAIRTHAIPPTYVFTHLEDPSPNIFRRPNNAETFHLSDKLLHKYFPTTISPAARDNDN